MTAPKNLPPSADKTAASPGEGATIPHRCECGHLDVFHAFNTKNTVRKACSVTAGRKAVSCTCKTYTPDIPLETSRV